MKLTTLTMLLISSGCVGQITGEPGSGGGGSGSNTAGEEAAIQKWNNEAYPIFSSVCNSCHGGGNAAAPPFLKSSSMGEMRTVLLGFTTPPVVKVDMPSMSEVLGKGAHEGVQALTPDQASSILDWITAEHDAATTTTDLQTDKVALLLCTGGTPGDATCPINIIKLDKQGLAGAEITFVAQGVGSNLYVTDLQLLAGTSGVYLEHPLFASYPDAAGDTSGSDSEIVDTVDRFMGVRLNLAATTTAPPCPGPSCSVIGAGAASFVGFDPANKISISFKALEAAHADVPPPPTVGCKTNGFAKFLTSAKPVLTGLCAGCHGGANSGAKNAMDLSGLASTTDNSTCLQVRLKLDFTTPANSPIFNPPLGLDNAHPATGKLTTATTPTLANFQTGINAWEAVEVNNN